MQPTTLKSCCLNVSELPIKIYRSYLQVPSTSEEQGELHPLYMTELLLEPTMLLFSPSLDDFLEGQGEVIKRFQDAVLSVANLVPDPYFDAFTRYALLKDSSLLCLNCQTQLLWSKIGVKGAFLSLDIFGKYKTLLLRSLT